MESAAFSNPVAWAALAPLLALIGSLVNGLFGRSLREPLPGLIASAAVALGFLLSLVSFGTVLVDPSPALQLDLWPFISLSEFQLPLGFVIDGLSLLLTRVITGLGRLIHIYSLGYMTVDSGCTR